MVMVRSSSASGNETKTKTKLKLKFSPNTLGMKERERGEKFCSSDHKAICATARELKTNMCVKLFKKEQNPFNQFVAALKLQCVAHLC